MDVKSRDSFSSRFDIKSAEHRRRSFLQIIIIDFESKYKIVTKLRQESCSGIVKALGNDETIHVGHNGRFLHLSHCDKTIAKYVAL